MTRGSERWTGTRRGEKERSAALRAAACALVALASGAACAKPYAPIELPPPPEPHVGGRTLAPGEDAAPASRSNAPAARVAGTPAGSAARGAGTPAGPGGRGANAPGAFAPGASPSGAVELAVSSSHACVRTTDGEVWCWGRGDAGELGDGRRGYAPIPKRVVLPKRAVRLDRDSARCAVLEDATVACWGGWTKAHGDRAAVPVQVVAGVSDVVFVSSEGARRIFIRRDGSTLFTDASARAPVVAPALAGAVEIVQSWKEGCARFGDGSVKCWSSAPPRPPSPARPGAAPPAPSAPALPPLVPRIPANAVGLAASCAVMADRTARCWGDNESGILGDGTSIDRKEPVRVLGLADAAQVSRGGHTACATSTDGRVRCWGDASEYPLIPGHPRRLHATPAPAPLDGIAEVAVGISHACARSVDGRVACWGRNQFAEIGDGARALERPTPSFVVGFGRSAPAPEPAAGPPAPFAPAPPGVVATDIAAGGDTTCARLSDGSARCWGKNDSGQLGDGTRADQPRPVRVPYLPAVASVRPGGHHTCAIGAGADAGAVFCWGFGGLGQAVDAPLRVPARVAGLGGVVQIAVGEITCALGGDGSVKCWGDYDAGFGDPGPTGSLTPTAVAGAGGLVEIAAGGSGACGRTAGGDVRCFGWGPLRALSGGRTPKRRAMPAPGIARAKAIAVGSGVACAVVDAGAVRCWGSGEVADVDRVRTRDDAYDVWVPVRAKGYDRSLDLALGQDGSCARSESRELACWRDGTLARPGLRDVVKVAHGAAHACALLANGQVHCWGSNDSGQLGDGTTTARSTPVRVVF